MKKKLGIILLISVFVASFNVKSFILEVSALNNQVMVNNGLTTKGVGDPIASIFPDPGFASDIANRFTSGDVNAILTQEMVDNFTYLNLSDDNIKDITGVEIFKNINTISINSTQLTTLPDGVCTLTKTMGFNLFDTKIVSLPECFGNLDQIGYFSLQFNSDFVQLPESFGNIKELRSIVLDDNPLLTSLPESLGNLTSLDRIDITRTPITKLPDSIGNLSNLVSINIRNTNLQELPDSIGNLASLRNLNITESKLLTLPESIVNIQTLEMIIVSRNLITYLPSNIGELSNLMALMIDANQLTSLPENIGNMKNCYISLSNNLLPTNYFELLNTLGFTASFYGEAQSTLHLLPDAAALTVKSGNDLNNYDFASVVKLIDGYGWEINYVTLLPFEVSSGHNYIFDSYVDSTGAAVDINDYIINGIVQQDATLFAHVRATGTGLFPNNSENALTAETIELNLIATPYQLSFDVNGGLGISPANQSLVEGQTGTFTNELVKDGFTFKGWNTKADGTGTYWISNTTVMPANDVILYAQWEPVVETTLPTTGSISYTFGLVSLLSPLIAYRIKKLK